MDENTPYQIELNGQTIRVKVTDANPVLSGTQIDPDGDGWFEADDWKCRTTLSRTRVEDFLRQHGFSQDQIDRLNMLYDPYAARAVAIDLNMGDHTYFLANGLGF